VRPPTPEERAVALARARALEVACDFDGGAGAALEAGDPVYAARLAALAGREERFAEVEAALVAAGPSTLARAAADLSDRGQDKLAARLHERAGAHLEAAEAYRRAGEPALAALAFERGGRPADGAKALERAIRDDPTAEPLRRALAELLLRHGRTEAAVKALQQMSSGPERELALPLLARSLRALGLLEAAAQVDAEVARAADPERAQSANEGAPEVEAAATGTVLYGRYEVVREVKKTPHAHLFEAIDRLSSQRVAVKVLAASARGAGRDAFVRFEREARALSKLRHPTIVALIDFIADGPAMVLEWMPGGSLADLMKRDVFAPARAVEIASAALTALGQAHRVGVLHRDVKPSNVLFDDVGTPKLGDFGAAHLGDASTTVTAGAIGTFAFMAPEQRMGRAATVQSDLYAVGAMLYEMLTGEPAEPLVDASGFVERPPSAFQPDLTAEHDAIVAPFLQELAERRPEGAFEARRLLESVRWPTRVLPRTAPASARSSQRPPPGSARLAAARELGDGRDAASLFYDSITERNVVVLPFDDAALSRVRSLARVSRPSIAAVLRASPVEGQIWVEAPRGRALADGCGPLTPLQIGELREALAAIHGQGGFHGCVDPEHVYLAGEHVFLACPRRLYETGSAVDDLRAVAALATG
jgi:serine/threonine protein kinase